MDTFWCPGCDKRIDTDLSESDLYCSVECKIKDANPENQANTSSNNNTTHGVPELAAALGKLRELKRSKSLQRQQHRPSYPWIPLYRRRPVVSRRAAVTASSAVTAQGLVCRKPAAAAATTTLPQHHQLYGLLA